MKFKRQWIEVFEISPDELNALIEKRRAIHKQLVREPVFHALKRKGRELIAWIDPFSPREI